MKKVILAMLGAFTSVLLQSNALFLESEDWTNFFVEAINKTEIQDPYATVLLFSWLLLPLISLLALVLAVAVRYLGSARILIYCMLSMSVFSSMLLDKFTELGSLSTGYWAQLLFVNNRVLPTVIFLVLFFVFHLLLKAFTGRKE